MIVSQRHDILVLSQLHAIFGHCNRRRQPQPDIDGHNEIQNMQNRTGGKSTAVQVQGASCLTVKQLALRDC